LFTKLEEMTWPAANENVSFVAAIPGCRAQGVAEYQLKFRKNIKKNSEKT
jgi:hypothetical protein